MLVKNKQILQMQNTITQVATKDIGSVKFRWGISRNVDIINRESEAIEKFRKPSDKFVEFERKREETVQKFAEMDETGQYRVDDRFRQYIVAPEKRDDLEKALDPLREEFKDAIEDREEQLRDFNELLEEETEVDFYRVDTDYIPEQLLAIEMSMLGPIWDDKEEQKVTSISKAKKKKSSKKKAKSE